MQNNNNKIIAKWRGGKIVGVIQPTKKAATNQFEAALPSAHRQRRTDNGSGNATIQRAGDRLRLQARHLDENHDLATGILDILVNRTVGRGIRYEPQTLDKKGNLHKEFNALLLDAHTRWSERPTTNGEYSRSEMERLYLRTWLRDGEAFKINYAGEIKGLIYNSETPYAIEPLEPDFCPLHYNVRDKNIQQGIKRNKWGRATDYYFHSHHPGEINTASTNPNNYRVIPAEFVSHIKFTKRFHQSRGQSIFHAVLSRLDDIKDYEEAERIAARIAAKMVGYIKKGDPTLYDPELDNDRTPIEMENGTMLMDMAMGEEVGLFDTTKRPNNGLNEFRKGQLKAVASGTMVSNSSASKNYDGTFSSQRQELIEQQEAYEVLQDYFISHSCKPDYKRFVQVATLAQYDIPTDLDLKTLFDVKCYGTSMPWIDPVKEAKANKILLDEDIISLSEVIRRRGENPDVVFKQIERDAKWKLAMKKLLGEDKVNKKSQMIDPEKEKKAIEVLHKAGMISETERTNYLIEIKKRRLCPI